MTKAFQLLIPKSIIKVLDRGYLKPKRMNGLVPYKPKKSLLLRMYQKFTLTFDNEISLISNAFIKPHTMSHWRLYPDVCKA